MKTLRSMRTSKKVVLAAISAVLAYWIAETILVACGKPYPQEMTISWFTFWSVELSALAGIKIRETRSCPYNLGADAAE
jgi:hypothetical protein